MAKKFTIPIALLGGLFLGLGELVRKVAMTSKDLRLAEFIHAFTGYWYPSKQWGIGTNGGMVTTIAILTGYGIHKGVGGMMGVNKAIGRAGVPIIRL